MQPRKSGFTLIELLVVITVIAILAGIALPVYSKVQESSRTVKCLSNLRQIGAALIGFAGDHNGLCPLSGNIIPYQQGADPSTPGLGWTQQLEPYIGIDKTIYVCPSSCKVLTNNLYYSYFQGAHAAYFANNNNAAALKLSLVSAPTKCILAGDISSNTPFVQQDADKDDFSQNPNGPPFFTTPCPFHNGKANLVFADGHCAGFAAFDAHAMNTHYNLKPDQTGYNYADN